MGITYPDVARNYDLWPRPLAVRVADGNVELVPTITVEVRMVDENGAEWGEWMLEDALIRPDMPGALRLSGMGIRQRFLIGTRPGNQYVALALSRSCLNSIL